MFCFMCEKDKEDVKIRALPYEKVNIYAENEPRLLSVKNMKNMLCNECYEKMTCKHQNTTN